VTYRKQKGVLGQSLEGFQQERCEQGWRLDHLPHLGRSARLLKLIEFAHGDLLAFLLVCNVRLVDLEGLLVEHKQIAPILLRGWLCVGLLDADEEAALEVEKRVEVQEDVVHLVTADDALFLDELLEFLQQLEMLDVGALRLD
jgi:hypothetical protein